MIIIISRNLIQQECDKFLPHHFSLHENCRLLIFHKQIILLFHSYIISLNPQEYKSLLIGKLLITAKFYEVKKK
jgi:hypothetical protein